MSSHGGGLSEKTRIAIGIAVSVVVVALIGACIYWWCKRRKEKKDRDDGATQGRSSEWYGSVAADRTRRWANAPG